VLVTAAGYLNFRIETSPIETPVGVVSDCWENPSHLKLYAFDGTDQENSPNLDKFVSPKIGFPILNMSVVQLRLPVRIEEGLYL
jgi:hypothetical protein